MLVNRANITTLIDRMEKAGLVARKPVPDDRRYNIIELTPHGVEMYQRVSGIYKRKVGEIMHVLDENELDALKTILEKLRKNLDTVPGHHEVVFPLYVAGLLVAEANFDGSAHALHPYRLAASHDVRILVNF